jgi:WD40 repeat protein
MRIQFIAGVVLLIIAFGSRILNQATMSTSLTLEPITLANLDDVRQISSIGESVSVPPQLMNQNVCPPDNDGITHYAAWMRYNYDAKTWYITERNRPEDQIRFNPDCTRFAALHYSIEGSSATSYAIFDAVNDNLLVELHDSLTDLARPVLVWSPDGSRLSDGTRSWSTSTGELLARLNYQGMSLGLPDAYWTADNQHILSVAQNEFRLGEPLTYVYLWNASTGDILYEKGFWHTTHVLGIQDGVIHAVSSGGYQYSLQVDALTGVVLSAEISDNYLADIQSIVWSPDSTHFVAISSGPSEYPTQMWNRETIFRSDKPIPLWSNATDWYHYEQLAEHYYPSTVYGFWLDNEYFVTTSRRYWVNRTFHNINTWRASDGVLIAQNYWSYDEWHPPMAEANPDLSRLAEFYPISNDTENVVRILDATTHTEQRRLTGDTMTAVSWSSTGNWLATFDVFGQDTTVEIWDLATVDEVPAIVFEAAPYRIVWSKDDELIALENGGTVIVYDPHSGQMLGEITSSNVQQGNMLRSAWSPDSNILSIGMFHQILFWDVVQQKTVFSIDTPTAVTHVAWSPDGQVIATVHTDNLIRLWGVPSTEE